MFVIVSSFSRENLDHNFFSYEFCNNEVVKSIHEKFETTHGSVELGILQETDRKLEIAMVFDNEKSFWQFVKENEVLLRKRQMLIDDYCQQTTHNYKYYTIDNED